MNYLYKFFIFFRSVGRKQYVTETSNTLSEPFVFGHYKIVGELNTPWTEDVDWFFKSAKEFLKKRTTVFTNLFKDEKFMETTVPKKKNTDRTVYSKKGIVKLKTGRKKSSLSQNSTNSNTGSGDECDDFVGMIANKMKEQSFDKRKLFKEKILQLLQDMENE